ncbi:DUF3617 domain-containing protein [Ramlibacter tataouinensis]|uniref:DUF3617 domain-containing protein n=1 Tax=Ramlibacter tataouinensis TaxID=94132 RepID=UPI0022F3FA78|nr:DUF3617 domain-containing protein [Ramlibacter tataouinensis]WBY00383.1 DUF3617 domain-containing protein [Ramlibacter tataouinensis]
MKKLPLAFAFALTAAGALAPAAAQSTLKPGLWEIEQRFQGNPELDEAMKEMREQMASMPPEQRKQMEAMMARQGVQMSGKGVRMCMTREMVERNDVAGPQGDCRTTQQQRSGNTTKVVFTCTNPPSRGESQITMKGNEAYTARTTITSTERGKTETTNMESSGKWLSADCGNVKPVVAPKGK